MKVQYCSDLHLEFWENRNFLKENPIVPEGEILILAGDIMLFSEMYRHEDFFDFLSKSFKTVYWIPGNHEYYHSSMDGRIGPFREQIRDNIFLLNDSVEIIENVRFVFSTLWSFINKEDEDEIWHLLNDFRLIKIGGKNLTPAIYNELHLQSKEFLTNTLRQKFKGNTVVVTHHVPTMQNYPSKYLGDVLNQAFASELKPLIEETKPYYWIYGHHHVYVQAYNIGKTTMLTNQLGYVSGNEFLDFSERANFEPNPKYPMAWPEHAKVSGELLSRQRPLSLEEMKASVDRVHAGRLQSVKESIQNAKEEPNTKIDELVKEQAEIANMFHDVISTSLPVVRLSNGKLRHGTWYEIVQPNQQESTICLTRPFYFERMPFWGTGLLIIQLCEHVLGLDETLLLRFENRGEGAYGDIHHAVSKKLSDLGYDGVIFFEKEPLRLIEVIQYPSTIQKR